MDGTLLRGSLSTSQYVQGTINPGAGIPGSPGSRLYQLSLGARTDDAPTRRRGYANAG